MATEFMAVGRVLRPHGVRGELLLASLTDFPGINGFYDFQKVPQRGLGVESAVIVRYEPQNQRWAWMSSPGGAARKP